MKRLKLFQRLMIAVLLTLLLALAGCSGSDGTAGSTGATGAAGADGAAGAVGATGPAGPVSLNPMAYSTFAGAQVSTKGGIEEFHGVAAVTAEDELQGAPTNPKYLATILITGATANVAGTVTTVTFTVKDKAGAAVTGLANIVAPATVPAVTTSAGIFKLAPKDALGTADGRNYNRWVPYIYRSGRTVNAGYRENNTTSTPRGALVENGVGTGNYTYTFGTNLATAAFLVPPVRGATLVGYDRTLTHRVSIYLGGHAGPTGEADFDFVPDGVTALQTRNIVVTATCKKCHGAEFAGHGGDRVTVEGCNTCHSPDSKMVNTAANGGATYSIEMSEMIHRMHAGRELASAPGADGIWFDDPSTTANEAADNGTYTLGSITASWRSAAFPAVIENCVVCHTGAGADVDNWKNVPSRAACGSCHDTTSFTSGATHAGGLYADDDSCTVCHQATTGLSPIVPAHDWTAKNIHNIPEFGITLTASTPANGTHFVAGEIPVITIVLKKAGVAIDHTTVVEQTTTAEGCTTTTDLTTCDNAADGFFRSANLIVTGPRAKRIPVLTTAARAKINSATTGTWDLSAGALSLRVVVDSGNFIVEPDEVGEDQLMAGDFTVKLPAAGAALNALFANPAAATAAEIAAWLNSNTTTFVYNERTWLFSDRAIASVGDGLGSGAGKLSIRTRARGSDNPSIQIPARVSATSADELNALLFTDNAVKVSGYSNQVRARANANNNDLKAVRTAANIKYTLDPIDADMPAGTYVMNVEFGDRGNPGAATYRTPSIAVTTFQIKQAAVEAPIADGCTNCHWSTGTVGAGVGFVLDPVRHNKPFNAQAVDQCGACHRYQSGETVATRTWTTGGGQKPLSKRVHAVHMGAQLNHAGLTVDHEESVAGRNWQITYPMEIRNCESCHSAATSGTWKTKPNRLACMGCHDSAAAIAHMKAQVSDPTPTAPWSGDEMESCAACH